jgi:hypothetical protein
MQPSYLILDGQQRLTSLYQALFAVGQYRFFLDVGSLLAGAEVDDSVRVMPADRADAFSTVEAQAAALMMPLARVRDEDSLRWIDSVVRARGGDEQDRVRSLLYAVQQTYIEPLRDYAFPVTVSNSRTSTSIPSTCCRSSRCGSALNASAA